MQLCFRKGIKVDAGDLNFIIYIIVITHYKNDTDVVAHFVKEKTRNRLYSAYRCIIHETQNMLRQMSVGDLGEFVV